MAYTACSHCQAVQRRTITKKVSRGGTSAKTQACDDMACWLLHSHNVRRGISNSGILYVAFQRRMPPG